MNPYEGNAPYIFVSYSHKDKSKVLEIVGRLQAENLLIWWDTGIELGSEWSEYIAEHIINCACVLAFHSQNSKDSLHCKHEIYFSQENKKPIISIYLEEVKFPPGIQMALSPYQAINFYKYAPNRIENFYSELLKANLFTSCFNNKAAVPIYFILDSSIPIAVDPISIKYPQRNSLILQKFFNDFIISAMCSDENNKTVTQIKFESYADEHVNKNLFKDIIDTIYLTADENPVVVLVTDGNSTDNYKKFLKCFNDKNLPSKIKKIAVGIGENVNYKSLQEFVSAENYLIKIKSWADTLSFIQIDSSNDKSDATFSWIAATME